MREFLKDRRCNSGVLRTLIRLTTTLLVLVSLTSPELVHAQGPLWPEGQPFRITVVPGENRSDHYEAGIAIALKSGYKTYWRAPGESGLAPSFSWNGSENLSKVDILWPAPRRFEEGGGASWGYEGSIILPLRVVPVEADKPVMLVMQAAIGICKDLCLPVKAQASLSLDKNQRPFAPLANAFAQVPKPFAFDAPKADTSSQQLETPLHILEVSWRDSRNLRVRAQVPQGQRPELFPELFLQEADGKHGVEEEISASEVVNLLPLSPQQSEVWFDLVLFRNLSPHPWHLRLTLTAGDKAIETAMPLTSFSAKDR
jgi:hypothetical protein